VSIFSFSYQFSYQQLRKLTGPTRIKRLLFPFPGVPFLGVFIIGILLCFSLTGCSPNQKNTLSANDILPPKTGSTFTFARNATSDFEQQNTTNSDTASMQIFATGVTYQGKSNATLLGLGQDTIILNYEPDGNISFFGISNFPWTTFPTGSGKEIESDSTSVEQGIYTSVNKMKTSIEKWDTLAINGKQVPCLKMNQRETTSMAEVDPQRYGTVVTSSMWFAPSLGVPVRYATEQRTREQDANHHLLYTMDLLSFELK